MRAVVLSGMRLRKTVNKRRSTRASKKNNKQVPLPMKELVRVHVWIGKPARKELNQAILDREDEGLILSTQAEILEDALWDWLEKHGHAKRPKEERF